MFLNTRLLSGSPVTVLIGLVFVAGMPAGAALQARVPAVVAGAAVHLPWSKCGRKRLQLSRNGRGSRLRVLRQPKTNVSSLQSLRLAAGGHPAEVLRVNDGDTFEARVHVWPGMQVTTKVRLRGIDAAEFTRAMRGGSIGSRRAARDALPRMLAEGGVTIGRIDFDKYGGRVVASAATRKTPDISDALLKTGLVRAYDGGRREGGAGGRRVFDHSSLRGLRGGAEAGQSNPDIAPCRHRWIASSRVALLAMKYQTPTPISCASLRSLSRSTLPTASRGRDKTASGAKVSGDTN